MTTSTLPDGGPLTTRREANKERTRAALVEAALELIEAGGGLHLTAEQVAETAGVSRRTFFNYFESVEELVAVGAADCFDALRLALDARPADEPLVHSFKAVIDELFTVALLRDAARIWRAVDSSPAAYRYSLSVSAATHVSMAQQWAARRLAERGAPADPLLAPVLMSSLMGAFEAARLAWLAAHPGPVGPKARADFVSTVQHAADLVGQGVAY